MYEHPQRSRSQKPPKLSREGRRPGWRPLVVAVGSGSALAFAFGCEYRSRRILTQRGLVLGTTDSAGARSGADRVVILGLSCDYHDSAAALVVDGEIVAAAEQERFSRIKHDASLPEDAVRACLEVADIGIEEVDHVVFYEKPLAIAARFLTTRQRQGPRGAGAFVRGVPDLLGKNLRIGPRVAAMMGRLGARRPPPLQFVEHHRSHAAAAFYPSPFDHAAVVTVDGLGEWASASIAHGAHHRLTLLEEQRFPHSIGLLYSLITAYCGFVPNSDEYKLMGLAPYGTDRFRDALNQFAVLADDGSFRIDGPAVRWFDPRALRSRSMHQAFEGPPRLRDAPITQREADLAASIQRLTEDAMLAFVARAHDLTGETDVCLAGGVALNSVANGRVLREGPFAGVWVQPAAGDAGSAIGAALSYWHDTLEKPRERSDRTDSMGGAFLGPGMAPGDDVARLEHLGIDHEVIGSPQALVDRVAERLAAGDVVGWYQGRMEFGPRALGHRSILADPRSPTARNDINLRVKGRESFRPFAPAVLADRAGEWFDLDQESPYMLVVAPVRTERLVDVGDEPESISERSDVVRSTIPACTHVDGSARVQTVDERTNPRFHSLLSAFDALTGCPVLLNTSFNRAGEPIVATVDQAVATAGAAGLDLLVIGSALIERQALTPQETPAGAVS